METGNTQASAIAGAAAAAVATKMFYVMDSRAPSGVTREHEIIVKKFDDGREPLTKKYKLGSDEPGTPMPMEHALKFLSDNSFYVMAPDGKRVTPPPKIEGGTGGYELPLDQTIANWDELAKAALFKRCKVVPGSEDIQPSDPNEKMIAFLINWRKAQSAGAEGIAQELQERLAGGNMEGMHPSEVNKLFGDD